MRLSGVVERLERVVELTGSPTAGHVDVLTRATRHLDAAAAAILFHDDAALAAAAATRSIADFDAFLKRKAKELDTSDAEERLERQRRATRLRTWIDDDGMWNLKSRFDPDLGKDLARRLASATRSKFAEETQPTAPADPRERNQHLEALALADLMLGVASNGSTAGPPLVVIDASQTDGTGGPVLDWGIPINGGRTDLDNLLPVCQHHHSRLHNDGWELTLGPNRELDIRVPDGNIMSTGPPRRSAA